MPREGLAAMCREAPITWQDDPEQGVGYWAVTSQEYLDYISKRPQQFSSAARTCFYAERDEDMVAMMRLLLINMDPPEHVKYRRVVRNAFTPKMVESYTGRFREVIREVIDKIVARGECEFVTEVACELPLIAICELVGIPIEDRAQFFEWTNTMIGADDPDVSISEEDGQLASAMVYAYADRLMELHRENPRDNLVGALLDGVVEGEHLTDDEFRSFFMILVVAGNETTRTMTSHGMRLLIEHPDQFQKLVDQPELVADAVEEILRYNPAVIQFRRTAMEDVEVGGVQMRKGDKIMLHYQASSNDERVFDQPEVFDITRPGREDVRNQHRAFGIGEHFCLGSHLARLELTVTFDEIVRRIRNPRLTGEIQWLRSSLVNGIKEMHIEFDVAG
jgi:cholest-4-en-3-one 26-monooxygenase